MGGLLLYYRSFQGKKFVMALTGVLLFLYVLFHMLGNLQLYIPGTPERPAGYYINRYAAFLHSTDAAPLLWTARVVLLVAVVLHILAATELTIASWGARGGRYLVRRYREAGIAARTMVWSGPAIGAFVVFHILHLTTGSVPGVPFKELSPYENLVHGFKIPWISASYAVAVILLGLHFWHGLWSWFQTLGWSNPAHDRARLIFARVMTAVVVLGDLSFPLAVLTGLVGGDVP